MDARGPGTGVAARPERMRSDGDAHQPLRWPCGKGLSAQLDPGGPRGGRGWGSAGLRDWHEGAPSATLSNPGGDGRERDEPPDQARAGGSSHPIR